MPVVIDYQNPSAVAQLAGMAGQAEGATKSAQLTLQQQQGIRQGDQSFLRNMTASGAADAAANARQSGGPARGDGAVAIDNQTGTSWTPQGGYQSQVPGGQAMVRYTAPDGSTMPVTAQQKQSLAQIDNNDSLDEPSKEYARNTVLKTPNTSSVTLANGQTIQLPNTNAASALTKQASQANQLDEFGQRMQQDVQNRQQQAQLDEQKLQTLVQLAQAKGADSKETEATALALKAHASVITQAKQALDFAQQGYTKAKDAVTQANQSFNNDAVNSASAALAPAKDAYDAANTAYNKAQSDFRTDVSTHIANLTQGKGLNETPSAAAANDPQQGQTILAAQKLGAVKITDDATAQQFLSAAGAGKVATPQVVKAAMVQANGDVAKAQAIVRGQGYLFTATGNKLQ